MLAAVVLLRYDWLGDGIGGGKGLEEYLVSVLEVAFGFGGNGRLDEAVEARFMSVSTFSPRRPGSGNVLRSPLIVT